MKIDKTQITGNRFMFAIACFLQSSGLLTVSLGEVTKQDSWIAVVIGIILYMPMIYVFRSLMLMFPNKNFLQMLTEIYGPVVGKIIGISYVWYFITTAALNTRNFGGFIKITVMTETPNIVLTLICILVVVWAVRNGIKVVARYAPLFTFILFVIVSINVVLLFNHMHLENFLPMFDQPLSKYIQGIHIISTMPLGELVVFLMITPCIKDISHYKITKYWYYGFAMGIIALLIILLRDISILGNMFHLFTLPELVTLRLVSLGETLSRIEILIVIVLIMLLFFKISILCYASVIAIAQVFETTAYKHLALIVGILIITYGPTLYPSSVEHITYTRTIEPFILSLFEIILPLLTFIIAKIRKLPKAAKPLAIGQET